MGLGRENPQSPYGGVHLHVLRMRSEYEYFKQYDRSDSASCKLMHGFRIIAARLMEPVVIVLISPMSAFIHYIVLVTA